MKKFLFLALVGSVLWVSCVHEPPIVPKDPTLTYPCDPDTVYFQNSILPLLTSNCAMSGCHDAGSASDGVILTNYLSIIQTGEVQPGNAGNSELYEVLTESDPDKKMPPPGSGLSLTSEEIQLVAQWINQGAQNNGCIGDCDTVTVSFSNHILPLVETYCQGCHTYPGASAGIVLSDYSTISSIANSGQLYGVTHGTGGYALMPPSGSLMQCELDQIRIWIQDGAPNN